MDQSPYQIANRSSARQVPNILWKHSSLCSPSPPFIPIVSQISEVRTHQFCFLKINFNIIFPSPRKSCMHLFTQPIASFLLGSNIFLNTLFSNTLCLCAFLTSREKILHTCNTTGISTVLYVLIYSLKQTRIVCEEKRL